MKKAFTLAEVLITLAIIGVVAAMTIPSVIVNANQQEFKTGIKKAVSVLNSAISMNIALEGESPAENTDLFNYLQQHMNVIASTTELPGSSNRAFYTTDGMRFEMRQPGYSVSQYTYEKRKSINLKSNGQCGVKGLGVEGADYEPCFVMVDVNGDKKPNPHSTGYYGGYTYASGDVKTLLDVFPIMITDTHAVPLGIAAQKAMYQSK